jgi:hypothetical protein
MTDCSSLQLEASGMSGRHFYKSKPVIIRNEDRLSLILTNCACGVRLDAPDEPLLGYTVP